MSDIIPVILAGGSGTRLWPMSREFFPKQFQSLISSKTLLQDTLDRLVDLDIEHIIIVCNEKHRFIAQEIVRNYEINYTIILEHEGKNTAPALALAAFYAKSKFKDPKLVVLPADHHVSNLEQFKSAILRALELCEKDKLITFGVKPDSPNTGYGYIKKGKALVENCYRINSFHEKPDLNLAREYLDDGDYYWNSGMFVLKADSYLNELSINSPTIYKQCKLVSSEILPDNSFVRFNETEFSKILSESIDYAVMEKTDNGCMIPVNIGWNDIGSWSALWDVSEKDNNGNVTSGDVISIDSRDNLILSEGKLVACIGVKGLVVVNTNDALLVCDMESAQNVKLLVDTLQKMNRNEHIVHKKVKRPWGTFETVDIGSRYQVKRISVLPKQKLSLQKHFHRAEHWVVVSGTAKIQKNEDEFLITENESVYIPVGYKHSLENPGQIPLEIIEVQSGAYLGEDDIVRFSDKYGRVEKSEDSN